MTRQPQPTENYVWTWAIRPQRERLHTCSDCGEDMLLDEDFCEKCQERHEANGMTD